MRDFSEKLRKFIKEAIATKKFNFFAVRQPYYTRNLANDLLAVCSRTLREIEKETLCVTRVLYPNQSIRNRDNGEFSGGQPESIYSFLYAFCRYTEKGQRIYNIKKSEGAEGKKPIIFILPYAHLLGNDKFETEDILYGSGYLLDDFLNFLEKEYDGKRAVILIAIGDPFQLLRGNRAGEGNLLTGCFFEKNGAHYAYWDGHIDENHETYRQDFFVFQHSLLQQIEDRKFFQLPACLGMIEERKKGESAEEILEAVSAWPKNAIFLCAERSKAQAVNQWVRKKKPQLKAKNLRLLSRGDVVLLQNVPQEIKEPQSGDMNIEDVICNSIESSTFYPGSFVEIIEVKDGSFTKSQSLKGRDKPVFIEFAYAKIRSSYAEGWICYLPEYLNSEEGELPADYGLVLRIWAKELADKSKEVQEAKKAYDAEKGKKDVSEDDTKKAETKLEYEQILGKAISDSPYKNTAYLHYGYAETVHKMQSLESLDTIFLSAEKAHDTENPATESYFRWLYTAGICAEKSLVVLNYPRLTPFSKTAFAFADYEIRPIIVKQRIYYKRAEPAGAGAEELPFLRELSLALVGLYNTVSALFAAGGWVVQDIKHFPYKERYSIAKAKLCGEIEFNYNGKEEVSLGKIDIANEHEVLSSLLQTKPIFQEDEIKFAVDAFVGALEKAKWQGEILSYEEKLYKIFLTLDSIDGKLKIELNVPSKENTGKKGIISSLKLLEAESSEATDKLKAVFEIGNRLLKISG